MPDDPFAGDILSCHVGKAVNNRVFENSQSGGLATALLINLMVKGRISAAVVATMPSAVPPRGRVLVAKNVDDLMAAQKSKYVPIPMLSRILESEGPLAFVGLPCHMHGLYNLIDLVPDLKSRILIKIGLVCDRVLTNASVDFLAFKAKCRAAKNFVFRDKNHPSYPGNVVAEDETGKQVVLPASIRMKIKDSFTPARCRLCFDKLNISADVVVGDPHGLEGIDRKRGESLIIIRTLQGSDLISETTATGTISLRKVEKDAVLEGQKISKKRLDWANYVHAWSKLGRNVPSFCEMVLKNNQPAETHLDKYKMSLQQSIGLDAFSSRAALIESIDRSLFTREMNISLRTGEHSFAMKSIQVLKKILKLLRHIYK